MEPFDSGILPAGTLVTVQSRTAAPVVLQSGKCQPEISEARELSAALLACAKAR